jgi:ABC-2 type transport system permease protein
MEENVRIVTLVKKDLRLLLRDRGQLIAIFLMPLAFIVPISIAFGSNGYTRSTDFKRPLPLANYDLQAGRAGAHAQELIDSLRKSFDVETLLPATQGEEAGAGVACSAVGPECDEAIARWRVAQSQRAVAVIIPAGFSAGIDAATPVTLTVLYDPVGNAVERQIYQGVLQGETMKLSIQNQVFSGFDQFQDMLALAPEVIQDQVLSTVEAEESDSTRSEQQPALQVVSVQPANYTLEQTPDTYQQTVPGYTVMYVFFLISYVVSSIRMERGSGAWRRQLYTPTSRSMLLGGKLLAALVVGLLQVTIMFGVGHFAFGMGLGSDPVALLLLTTTLVMTAVSFGLLASTFKSEGVITVPLIVLALIGGCMFPSSWLPPFIRTIGYAVPHTYAMSAYQDLLVRGQGLSAVAPEVLTLLTFAAVAFVVAVRRFEFE